MNLDFSRRPTAPLLPPPDRRDTALVFVIAALCFLASLTFVAALGAHRAAEGWQSQLIGSATVVVRPKSGETADGAAARATEALAGVKGVVQAAMLEQAEAEDLLRPWLGADVLADLPVPRLVALELDRKAPATVRDLNAALTTAGVDATVDDHSLWIKDIVRAGRIAQIAAGGVAALLALIAAAVIVVAARAALAAHRQAVEVLHLTGAEDRFVARLFMVRFARLAAAGGAYGAGAAVLVGIVLRLSGGTAGLTPVLPVAWSDLYTPLVSPFAAAMIGAVAARAAALGLLRSLP